MLSKKSAAKRKFKSIFGACAFIIAALCVVIGRFNSDFESVKIPSNVNADVSNETVVVHIIDVGQGSSALIQCGESGILIDGGEREYGETVVSYLKKAGIKKLDYVVASHPHSDHIGGLISVFDAFAVDNVIMPTLTESNMPTTRGYERFLEKIGERSINAVAAEYGAVYKVGNAAMKILGPTQQDEDLNNMSVVCKVQAAGATFIFPGDAEKAEMKSISKYNPDLSCNVMVMAHHGSSTSLEKDFLKSANFGCAVISCGRDNSYGHPHEEIVDYLEKNGIEYYRTDIDGNIIFTCSSEGYSIKTKK